MEESYNVFEQASDTNNMEENFSSIEVTIGVILFLNCDKYDSSTIEDQIFYVKAVFQFRGSGDQSELIFEKDDVLIF